MISNSQVFSSDDQVSLERNDNYKVIEYVNSSNPKFRARFIEDSTGTWFIAQDALSSLEYHIAPARNQPNPVRGLPQQHKAIKVLRKRDIGLAHDYEVLCLDWKGFEYMINNLSKIQHSSSVVDYTQWVRSLEIFKSSDANRSFSE